MAEDTNGSVTLLEIEHQPMYVTTPDDIKRLIEADIHDATLIVNGELLSARLHATKTSTYLLRLFCCAGKRNLQVIVINTLPNKLDKLLLLLAPRN